jgi:choline dehydrogenase-like flavoprotein
MNPDYIIVGGGLCGCVLASRLREGNPSLRIVLIEACVDSTDNPLTTAPFGAFAERQSEIDWSYATVPQTHLNNRTYRLAAGKILSGGTAINTAAWTRGSKAEYDHWGKVVGDTRWSYDGLLSHFRKSERHWDSNADTKQHGFDGPIYTSSVTSIWSPSLLNVFIPSCFRATFT